MQPQPQIIGKIVYSVAATLGFRAAPTAHSATGVLIVWTIHVNKFAVRAKVDYLKDFGGQELYFC